MSQTFLKILETPTAPTKEDLVLNLVKKIADSKQMKNFFDASGNLIIGAKKINDLENIKLIFVAHADHPGGIVIKKQGTQLLCKWLGGLNVRLYGQKVIIFEKTSGNVYRGAVAEQAEHQRLNKFIVETESEIKTEISELGICLDTPVKIVDDTAYCRGADNLASVAAIGLFIDRFSEKNMPFAFVLTRCEEEGKRGANFVSKYLSKNTRIISVDVSDRLPGIGMGSGLVIKYGDAKSLFDRNFTNSIVSFCKKSNINFSEVYRTSGENEASEFCAQNLISTSIGVAIHNYHNFGIFNQTARSEEFLTTDIANLISFFDRLQKTLN